MNSTETIISPDWDVIHSEEDWGDLGVQIKVGGGSSNVGVWD